MGWDIRIFRHNAYHQLYLLHPCHIRVSEELSESSIARAVWRDGEMTERKQLLSCLPRP